MRRFGDPRRRSWASDHERARQRAAEQLSLPLPAAEAVWLAEHLRLCPSCARVAAQYAQHRDQLRKLRPVDPPRDLWARTSAALDRVDRDFARREKASGSGPLARHGVRSRDEALRNLRALRSERQATALARFRSVRRANMPAHVHAARRAPNHGWALPFAALAAFTVMVATGGGLLLTIQNGPFSNGLPVSSGPLSAAVSPGATPITVGPGEVAWLTPNANGGYSLNLANVEHVCPNQAEPDCAPLAGDGSRHLPSLAVQPGTVVQSPSKGQLVVVDKSAKGSGGSVYVVAVPARVETPEPADDPDADRSCDAHADRDRRDRDGRADALGGAGSIRAGGDARAFRRAGALDRADVTTERCDAARRPSPRTSRPLRSSRCPARRPPPRPSRRSTSRLRRARTAARPWRSSATS